MSMKFFLKPVLSRKLKNGDWIVLADGANPLVVGEELANNLVQNDSLKDFNIDVFNILKENDFYTTSLDKRVTPPKENTNLKWKILRFILFTIGIISVISVIVLTFFSGVPNGNKLISHSIPITTSILFAIFFSIITTLFHELMHIIFAQSFEQKAGGLRFRFIQSTVTVSMTHIWVWSLNSRLAALLAGLIFDFFLLACLLIITLFMTNWMTTIAISTLWLRIIWQFRFHKNCDGQLIALTLLDNPMLIVSEEKSKKEVRTWNLFKLIGYFIEIFIVVYWLIPFVWGLFQKLY